MNHLPVLAGDEGRSRDRPGAAPVISCEIRVESGGGLCQGDVVAERFELADEAGGAVLDRVAAGEPVGAEVFERNPLVHDVVVGDEDVVAGGSECFGLAAAAGDLGVMGGEVRALGAGHRPGCLGQCLP